MKKEYIIIGIIVALILMLIPRKSELWDGG